MRNAVPVADDSTATTIARRSLADRVDAYAAEVRALLDAALQVMAAAGTLDPPVRDIVRTAGLSNQAFYRHFPSKDALLLALLDDGDRRLVATLERRMSRVDPGMARVRAWIEGVLAQARDPRAAAATRPFVVNAARLAERFPEENAAITDRLLAPLRAELGDERDVRAVHALAMGTMHRHVLAGRPPSRADVDHVVRFALAGVGASAGTRYGIDLAQPPIED